MALPTNFVIISLLFSLMYFVGFISFLTDYQGNKCEMTFMFEYPQFVKISMAQADRYPRYGLYAYSEGKFTERARAMKFDGVPVLFIPGNAGSFKQVRSLASVSLRKALNSRSKYHFDFFTVDLNDELSGLNGALLNEQTSFLNESIDRILSLYQPVKYNKPNSVILIGHSMGGVIGHGLLINSDKSSVELLITLGSPHRRPSINLDTHIAQYYDKLQNKEASHTINNLTLITIGGGKYDRLVNSWLTNASNSSINVVATAIPSVWLSTDHASLVWCKQLVLAIIRGLFDSLDGVTKQLSPEPSTRLAAFKHHLLTNSGTNFQQRWKYRSLVTLEVRGEWQEDLRRQYTVVIPKKTNHVNYYMIRLFDDPKHQALFIEAVNLISTDWIFVCSANVIQGQSRVCHEASHLSHRSELAPTLNYKRKTFYMDLFKLKRRYPEYSHVIIRVLPVSDPVSLNIDIHNPKDRLLSVDLPNWYSLSRKIIVEKTIPDALRYVIEMPGLQHVIQHYLLYVEPISCTKTSHHAVVRLNLPWAHHDSHVFITEGYKKPLLLRLHNSRPIDRTTSTAKVILTLDPSCQYTISVRNSWIGMMSQLSRYYSTLLIANIAAVILITFYSQMVHLDKERHCINFQAALNVHTKPYYLVTVAKLISRILAYGRLADIFPTPDGQILLNDNMDFLLLPIILYVSSVGITYLISLGLWAALILSESTVHKFAVKCVTKTVGGALKWSDWLLNAVHKVPCIIAITLFSLGLSTCGAMSLCLGTVYYFLKLTQICQEYIEGLVFRYIKKIMFKFIGLFKRRKNSDNQTDSASTEPPGNVKKDNDSEVINSNIETSVNNIESINDDKNPTVNENVGEIISEKENEDSLEPDMRQRIMESNSSNENQIVASTSKDDNKNETKDMKKDNVMSHESIHFHFSLFLLWLIVSVLNIPSVLTWARNFQYV